MSMVHALDAAQLIQTPPQSSMHAPSPVAHMLGHDSPMHAKRFLRSNQQQPITHPAYHIPQHPQQHFSGEPNIDYNSSPFRPPVDRPPSNTTNTSGSNPMPEGIPPGLAPSGMHRQHSSGTARYLESSLFDAGPPLNSSMSPTDTINNISSGSAFFGNVGYEGDDRRKSFSVDQQAFQSAFPVSQFDPSPIHRIGSSNGLNAIITGSMQPQSSPPNSMSYFIFPNYATGTSSSDYSSGESPHIGTGPSIFSGEVWQPPGNQRADSFLNGLRSSLEEQQTGVIPGEFSQPSLVHSNSSISVGSNVSIPIGSLTRFLSGQNGVDSGSGESSGTSQYSHRQINGSGRPRNGEIDTSQSQYNPAVMPLHAQHSGRHYGVNMASVHTHGEHSAGYGTSMGVPVAQVSISNPPSPILSRPSSPIRRSNSRDPSAEPRRKRQKRDSDGRNDGDGDSVGSAHSHGSKDRHVNTAVKLHTANDESGEPLMETRVRQIFYNRPDFPKPHRIRLIEVIDLKSHARSMYAHGADVGSVVERKSNISRLFGKFTSPDEKLLMNVPGCLTFNHSVLTNHGWKNIQQLEKLWKNDQLAWHQQLRVLSIAEVDSVIDGRVVRAGSMIWATVNNVVKIPIDNTDSRSLYQLESDSVDLVCTLDHKHVTVNQHSKRVGGSKLTTAELMENDSQAVETPVTAINDQSRCDLSAVMVDDQPLFAFLSALPARIYCNGQFASPSLENDLLALVGLVLDSTDSLSADKRLTVHINKRSRAYVDALLARLCVSHNDFVIDGAVAAGLVSAVGNLAASWHSALSLEQARALLWGFLWSNGDPDTLWDAHTGLQRQLPGAYQVALTRSQTVIDIMTVLAPLAHYHCSVQRQPKFFCMTDSNQFAVHLECNASVVLCVDGEGNRYYRVDYIDDQPMTVKLPKPQPYTHSHGHAGIDGDTDYVYCLTMADTVNSNFYVRRDPAADTDSAVLPPRGMLAMFTGNSHNHTVGQESNILTELGIQRFLETNKMKGQEHYKHWIKSELIPIIRAANSGQNFDTVVEGEAESTIATAGTSSTIGTSGAKRTSLSAGQYLTPGEACSLPSSPASIRSMASSNHSLDDY